MLWGLDEEGYACCGGPMTCHGVHCPCACHDEDDLVCDRRAARDDVLAVLRMTGRCATGAERDGGRRWHLVPPGTVRALCGARPGRHSGWSPHPGVTATCPRCMRAAARRAAPEASR